MKLQLAYDNELELPNLPTHRGRVNYINKNMFDSKDLIFDEECGKKRMSFEEFYNIRSLETRSEIEEKQIRDRWLGVKRVGSPNKDEHVKLTLDFIAGYILYCKEHSAKHEVHMYKLLKRKSSRKSGLTESEEEEFKKIKRDVISCRLDSDKEIVFYFNRPYESFLKRRIKTEKDTVIKERLSAMIKSCKELRRSAKITDNRIKDIEGRIADLRNEIKVKYEKLSKDRNNTAAFEIITKKIKSIRALENDIYYLDVELENLTDEYLQITELQINLQ